MSRGVDSQFSESLVRPAYFVELQFKTATTFNWDGVGPITTLSETWQGLGDLLSISDVKETRDLKATEIELTLDGVDPSNISIAHTEEYQGRKGIIYLGALNADDTLASTPVKIFSGLMDVIVDEDNGETSTLTLSLVSRFIDHLRQKPLRYTDQGQKSLFPNDKGLEFVSTLPGKTIFWGKS